MNFEESLNELFKDLEELEWLNLENIKTRLYNAKFQEKQRYRI